MQLSLRRHLSYWLLGPLLLLVAAGSFVSYRIALSAANKAYDSALLDPALAIASHLRRTGAQLELDLPSIAIEALRIDTEDRVYYQVLGPAGELIAGTPRLPAPPERLSPGEHIYYDAKLEGEPVRIAARAALPGWLTTFATASPRRVRILRPSDAPEEEAISPARRGVDRESVRLRGRLAHRLLQSLPDIPAARRRKAADNYLARNGRALSEDERAQLAERIVALLDNARFRAVFSADSRAEVPIAGTLDGGLEIVRVSGQIDRLAVTPDAVLIADFKTNTDPPRRFVEVPDAYKRQLALYRAVLQKMYPGRPVRAALIWTEVPDLMELSAEVLDEAMRRVTSE